MANTRNDKGQFESKAARTPRENDTRAEASRQTDAWKPASKLPAPNPVDGWDFRYVRTSTLGHADVTNVSQAFREGWVAVPAEEVPEISERTMSDIDSRFEGCCEYGGQLLCKLPTHIAEQRKAHFAGVAKQQMDSVDHSYMNENDPRAKRFSEKKTRTTFGGG